MDGDYGQLININLSAEDREWLVSRAEYTGEDGKEALNLHIKAFESPAGLDMILLTSIAREIGVTPPFNEQAFVTLVRIAERMRVTLGKSPSIRYGGYNPRTHQIALGTNITNEDAVIILSHELAHSLLNYQEDATSPDSPEYAESEIAAQTTAHLLLRELGVNSWVHSNLYVRHYLPYVNVEALPRAAHKAIGAARGLAGLAKGGEHERREAQ